MTLSPSLRRSRSRTRNCVLSFERLEDRWVLASLNAQYIVELQTHSVALGYDHLSLLITPQNASLYGDADGDNRADQDPLFVKRADGSFALSLGGGPDGNTLVSAFNRGSDIALHTAAQRSTLSKPSLYKDSREWVNALISRSANYGDNLDYDLFPELLSDVGYNSNSFIAGLLAATGTIIANPSGIFADGDYPGFPTPVPTANFGSSLAQRLDLIFLIDTTSSMGDDIDAVKSAATEIVNKVHTELLIDGVSDARVAVADYRDFPVDPYGEAGDYEYGAVQHFRSSASAAISGIQMLSLGSGGDFPESVYSGLMEAIESDSLGSWRGEGVSKMIIVMGDAPPHDPEPFTGYTGSIVNKAAEDADPVVIFPVVIGGGATAAFQFLADGTGGKLLNAANASQVVDAILDAVDAFTNTPVADARGPYSGFTGQAISFDASTSFDPNGDIVLYEWDWESDGVYDLSTTVPFAQHTWTTPFTGRTRVRVTDEEGLANFDWADVTVASNPKDPGFSYVDANNDHVFNVLDGDIGLVSGETDDGRFDTKKKEGNYKRTIAGAGLVINGVSIYRGRYISFVADGDLVINTDLTSADGIQLQSRKGSVLLDDPTISAGAKLQINAKLDIVSTDDMLQAGEVYLNAKRNIRLNGTPVLAQRAVDIVAGSAVVIVDSAAVQAVVSAVDARTGKAKVSIEAGQKDLEVSGAEINAVKEVKLKSKKGSVVAIGADIRATDSKKGAVRLEAARTIDVSNALLQASAGVAFKAKERIPADLGQLLSLGQQGAVRLEARDNISLTSASALAFAEIEVESNRDKATLANASVALVGSKRGEIDIETKMIDIAMAELKDEERRKN